MGVNCGRIAVITIIRSTISIADNAGTVVWTGLIVSYVNITPLVCVLSPDGVNCRCPFQE